MSKTEYVSCNICGGMGNQLFQIAATLDYANKYNKKAIFKDVVQLYNQHGFERKTQWETLFSGKLNVLAENEYNKIHFNTYNEIINNVYNELPRIKGNVLLNGYFQALGYISKNTRLQMQNLIYSSEDNMYKAYDLYNEIKKFFDNDNDDDYVSIHVRRGDYVYIQNFHNILDMDYYINAYNIVCNNSLLSGGTKKKNIVLFTDDVDWCINNFKMGDNKIYYVNTNNLCIDLILMSFIKHNILANSSFSWWASYISNFDDKIVVAPKTWFGRDGPRQWKDMYHPSWIVI